MSWRLSQLQNCSGRRVACEKLNGADGISDIEGKAAMVAASELGSERVSNEREHMSQRFGAVADGGMCGYFPILHRLEFQRSVFKFEVCLDK